MASLFEIALAGVALAAALIGGWSIVTGRTPGWVRLTRMPVGRYVRWWGTAALLLGVGAFIVVIAWSSPYMPEAAALVGFALQALAVGIWLYIRSKAGFIEG